MGKFKQGFFNPKYPDKWVISNKGITKGKGIRYMSSWELKVMKFLDENQEILKISSEPFPIPYKSPKDNKEHNYYPDFYCCLRSDEDADGTDVKKMIIEIKPLYQTERPIPPPVGAKLQDQKRFNEATRTYIQNVKKWEAAMAWCAEHDMEFKVFTEVTLQKMGII